MLYTVKEVSEITRVTVKALHHYHKIGLLLPCKVNEAGYRFYGTKELERLQQILFYRELDFPLKEIKQILNGEHDRLSILNSQKKLLQSRIKKMERLIDTIDQSIWYTAKGEHMDQKEMFKGFNTSEEWTDALQEQNEYLKEHYQYDLLEKNEIDVQEMNESALEAKCFIEKMADALKNGIKHNDGRINKLIDKHIHFLNDHGHQTKAADFAMQTRFFLNDDFHRNMLESQQTGLSYYLCLAAEDFASVQ
ncbi:MerR family transcriptional regulator [Heyndrickxia ginsengihumi]|uniref:MerR family transcriptional regulator n=1 Tax=Heyndrickxia ginsengihumi TaxID=363870 RepID=UPI003D1A6E44